MELLELEFKFPDWKRKLQGRVREVYLAIAAAMQTNRGMLFDREGSYNGHEKWKPPLFRNGQALSDRGTLRKSIAPGGGRVGPNGIVRFSGDTVTIGTKMLSARLMNDGTAKLPGGVLKPKNAQALRIKLPSGKKATPLAKELRKTAGVKSSIILKLKEVDENIQSTKNPERLANLKKIRADLMDKIKSTGAKDNDRYLFLKSVKIPARNFEEVNEQDATEILGVMMEKIAQILGS